LGNIDTGVDVLEACVGSNKVNVNISSGNISGFATESTLGDAEAHLGTIDTNIANAEAHLGNIDTGVDALESCVKTEDLAHSSGDKGFMVMGVRNSDNTTQATFGTQDGDYCPFSIDDDGGVRVHTNDAVMEVSTLLNAGVGAGSTGTSTTFTKPRGIDKFAFACVASDNGSYNAFIEASVDGSTFFAMNGGQSFNIGGNAQNFQDIGTSQVSSAFKFYKVVVANNHSATQTFVVKVCF